MPGGAEHPVSGSRDLSRAEQLQSGDSFQRWFYRAKPSPNFPKSELLRRGRQGSEALTEGPPPPASYRQCALGPSGDLAGPPPEALSWGWPPAPHPALALGAKAAEAWS